MSGTADDPIDLEALDAAIATADRADSTTKQRVDAQRALLTVTGACAFGHRPLVVD
eukprot:COSAG06_NODE_33_length_31080_cov_10.329428_11_plen_56_part_00